MQHFGRFQIERLLGRGGMGCVFLAFDPQIGRRVALKIPHPGSLVDSEVRERFLREARAAGGLKHAGIVPVFESGHEGDVCYLVSEYCEGPNLAEWLSHRLSPVPVRMAAALVARLAGAVQHAHDRGILHRDLKPANVLLDDFREPKKEDQDSRNDSAIDDLLPFMPRITDFGLAQIADDAVLTRTGAAIGTVAYMAPEQADGRREALGPPSDVFALGAILYELLCGEPPFGKQNAAAILTALRQSEPTPLVRRRRDVPRDLDAICLKCLEKRPERRYASAAELRNDLMRFLYGEPTVARPVSAPERLVRWARRSPSTAALAALLVMAVAGLLVGLAWHSHQLAAALATAEKARERAEVERQRAEEAAQQAAAERRRAEVGELRARQLLYATDMTRALQAWRNKEHLETLAILAEHVPAPGEPDLRGFEWQFLQASCRPTPDCEFRHGAPLRHVAVTPDGARLLTAGDDACIRVWNLKTGALLATLRDHEKTVREVAVSPDGGWLVSGGDDGRVVLWSLRELRRERVLGTHTTGVETVAWSPKGRWIATGARYSDVRVWTLDEGLVLTIEDDGRHESLTFSADDRLLYLPQKLKLVVWDLEEKKELRTLKALERHGPRAMCALAGGALLACTDRFDPFIVIFNPASNKRWARLTGDCEYSNGLAASRDGRWLASAGTDGAVRLYDVSRFSDNRFAPREDEGRIDEYGVDRMIVAHEGMNTAVGFVSDSLLVTAGEDGAARLWDLERLADWLRVGPRGHCKQLSLVANEQTLWIGSYDRPEPIEISPAHPHAQDKVSTEHRLGLLSPDGRWFAAAHSLGKITIWDCQSQQVHATLASKAESTPPVAISLHFAPSGELAAAYKDGWILLWNVGERRLLRELQMIDDCRCVRFSSDGRYLAAAGVQGLTVWEWRTGRITHRITDVEWAGETLAWSPDGRLLAIGQSDNVITLWDTETWRLQTQFTGHTRRIDCAKFAPNGNTLLTGAADGSIRLWHVPTGRPLGVLYQSEWAEEFINDVIVPHDGRFLAAATQQLPLPSVLASRAFAAPTPKVYQGESETPAP